MRLPDCLSIGAMKAGTTSLYRDLLANSAVFMPIDKEPWNLAGDDVCQPEGLRQYAKLFEKAKAHQVCGEASTVYSQLPDITGVPRRAREVLGDRLMVIYLVREPVSRIVSHHHHLWLSGAVACGIDDAVHRYPRFINYSRYAMQIEPWREVLGPQQVLIVQFETYINDRRGTVASVSRFLGIEPQCEQIRAETAYNKSEGKPVPKGPVANLRHRWLYRTIVRPLLPLSAREKLRSTLLPKAQDRPDPPSIETVRYIIEQVRDDAELLRAIMSSDEPLWDFQDVLRRYEVMQTSQR